MARPAPTTHFVNQAEVEGAIAGYFGVSATTPGISDLARVVFPGVQSASRQNPAGWRSVVLDVLATHIGLARGLGLQGSELQRQLEIMRHSNRTSADFVQALARVQTLVAGMGGWSRVAAAIDRGATGDGPSSLARAMEMNGGPYTEHNLSTEMRRYVGFTSGANAAHVAQMGNYLHSLDINPHQYAGYFVGSSDTVRRAIRDHIHNRQALTDEHVTNANDARAIIGAIRAGRVRLEDAPPSVRALMEQMESDGVDPTTADPSAIQGYFEQNPQALERARAANTTDISLRAGATTSEVEAERRRLAELHGAPPPPAVVPTQVPPVTAAPVQPPPEEPETPPPPPQARVARL